MIQYYYYSEYEFKIMSNIIIIQSVTLSLFRMLC